MRETLTITKTIAADSYKRDALLELLPGIDQSYKSEAGGCPAAPKDGSSLGCVRALFGTWSCRHDPPPALGRVCRRGGKT